MRYYQPNSASGRGRCSTNGLMGPAVLITLGVLFLLANTPGYPFARTWPILLIVIGAIRLVQYFMPIGSHLNPEQYETSYAGPYAPPGTYSPSPYQHAPEAGAAQYGTQNGTAAAGSAATLPPARQEEAAGDGGEGSNEVDNG